MLGLFLHLRCCVACLFLLHNDQQFQKPKLQNYAKHKVPAQQHVQHVQHGEDHVFQQVCIHIYIYTSSVATETTSMELNSVILRVKINPVLKIPSDNFCEATLKSMYIIMA